MKWTLLFGLVVIAAPVANMARAENRTYGTMYGWGSLIDPDGDCTFSVGNDRLIIGVPATPHDLSTELNRVNAPRVLQSAPSDFEITVRVSGSLEPDHPTVETRTAYAGAGLLLIRDNFNYIRLERAALRRGSTTRHYVNFEQRQDGRITRFGRVDDLELNADDDVQLKMIVAGTTVTGQVRTGDDDWKTLGEKPITATGTRSMGIAAINATTAPLNAEFHALRFNTLEPGDEEAKVTPDTPSDHDAELADPDESSPE